MKSPALSESELRKVIDDSAEAAKPAEKLPTWDDVRSNLKTPLTYNADGSVEANVPIDPTTPEGRRALGAYAELLTPYHRASADRAARVRAREARVDVIGPRGEKRRVREEHAERVERRHFQPRASIIVPELPWKKKRRKKKEDA